MSAGQRLAEQVAAFVGSWWFLGGQAGFLVLWLIYNTLQFTVRFDPPPYILLNLLLSFQAAFTGPVLLIAANVGAARDHLQADRIENLGAQNERLTEANEQLTERLLAMEQMLERHVVQSLKAHSDELHNQGMLLRAVHAAVCADPPSDGVASQTGESTPPPSTAAAPSSSASGAQARARRRRGQTPEETPEEA
ncbi:MAG TPA: DUF1003 domain-containing protein [Ktedonobacterales bacterium]